VDELAVYWVTQMAQAAPPATKADEAAVIKVASVGAPSSAPALTPVPAPALDVPPQPLPSPRKELSDRLKGFFTPAEAPPPATTNLTA